MGDLQTIPRTGASTDLTHCRATGGAPAAATAPPDVTRRRVVGVDIARGLALVGMMAVHLFPIADDDGTQSVAWQVFGGRSAALFAMLAGVSLAFLSGGRQALHGRERVGASAGIAARAVLIGLVGLALGYVTDTVDIILAFYAVLFLLAIPLLGLSARALALLAVASAFVFPVIMQLARDSLPAPTETNPTFGSLGQPGSLVSELLLTGSYPALPWLTYFCAGLAIGRLLRTSTRLAARLLVGGTALAVGSWLASIFLLTQAGGVAILRATSGLGREEVNDILTWGPDPSLPTSSWWWLAIHSPHSSTPFDLLHTLGTSMAVLGAVLLLTRVPRRVLRPLAMAGSMTLTLYTVHVLFIGTGLLADLPYVSYAVQVAGVVVLALAWRATHAQGPLEQAVGAVSKVARRAVLAGRPG